MIEDWQTEEGHNPGTASGAVIEEPGPRRKCVPPECVRVQVEAFINMCLGFAVMSLFPFLIKQN